MHTGEVLVEVLRGGRIESVHSGHAVICDDAGKIIEAWGNPDQVIYPRSSCKMIQALPLVESGAADAYSLTPKQLALACASHLGAAIHSETARDWLTALGLDDNTLRCGSEMPRDGEASHALIRSGSPICQYHNNCSGKHSGFLTLAKHLGAGPEYVDPDHPVQRAVLAAFEETTGAASPGFGIDGCSAPNFATTLHGLARAMASFATAGDDTVRDRAQRRLVAAMTAHPEMVSGEGGADTDLMRAMEGRVAVKTGAEGVYVAIAPERRLGMAVKIADGTTRGAQATIAALLVRMGLLSPDHPATKTWMTPVLRNRRDIEVGAIRPAETLLSR